MKDQQSDSRLSRRTFISSATVAAVGVSAMPSMTTAAESPKKMNYLAASCEVSKQSSYRFYAASRGE
jgi:hypothetical protein